MLVTYGTDDAAKIWINETAVVQEEGLSAWNLGESMLAVPFQKGVNTVLVRIENGPNVCQFSFLITPQTK